MEITVRNQDREERKVYGFLKNLWIETKKREIEGVLTIQ